jgi:hypothetical protein
MCGVTACMCDSACVQWQHTRCTLEPQSDNREQQSTGSCVAVAGSTATASAQPPRSDLVSAVPVPSITCLTRCCYCCRRSVQQHPYMQIQQRRQLQCFAMLGADAIVGDEQKRSIVAHCGLLRIFDATARKDRSQTLA